VDKLLKLRQEFNDQGNGKYKLSVNDFVIKAAALANVKVPEANSSWNDQFIRRFNNVDINVAINTDRGLLTPFVANADKIGLTAISERVKDLATRGKEGKLKPEELSGGTFTISNLGMFGIKSFSAVINPPQVCILAVGATEQKVAVKQTDPKDDKKRPRLTVANIMNCTLSCDHRVVDGAIGARWLQHFREYIEDPSRMLL